MKRILTTLIFVNAALAQTPAAVDAISALRAVNSATEIGVNQHDYLTRVADAKTKVDAYIDAAAKNDPQAKLIAGTMRIYVLAAKAWRKGSTFDDLVEVGTALTEESGIADIPALAKAVANWNIGNTGTEQQRKAFIGSMAGLKVGFLWHCAAGELEALRK